MLYISPECLKGEYDQKCDIWSLAVVLYALISAEFPFEGQNSKEISRNIQTMTFTTPSIPGSN